MSKITFSDFQQQVIKLYYANEYVRALAFVEEKQTDYPEHSNEIAYWRLCFHALLGKQKEALQIFHETLELGG